LTSGHSNASSQGAAGNQDGQMQRTQKGERKMTRRGVLIAAIILALASAGFADSEWDAGYVDQDVADFAFWLGPDVLVILGYMGQDAILEPGSGAVAQSSTIVSVETTGPGTQSTYVSVSQVSVASSNGSAWVDANVTVLTSQSTP
jgi:hypothetical protein